MENQNYGNKMLQAIRSGDVDWCQEAITDFKQFIKRNLVDLSYVPAYVTSLISAYNVRSLSILSFSTLCHLIKRVSIQEPSILVSVYDPVLPFLIQTLNETKDSIRLTAIKSLKIFIECAPNGEIDLIIEYLLKYGINVDFYDHQLMQISVLNIFYQIIESSNSFTFSFKLILESIVKLLNTDNNEILSKCNEILSLYFKVINPTNNSAKTDLLNALMNYKISSNTAATILQDIDQNLYNRYLEMVNPSSQIIQTETSEKNHNEQLNDILTKIPNWDIEEISPSDDTALRYETLYSEFELHFDDKETEKNWKYRQSLIIKLRQILRGEDLLIDIDNFVILLKNVKECIVKGMMSLRTTLCNNTCQLCKELGIYVGGYLDSSLVEYLLINLLKLTSSRKIIQHQNSNVGIISLLLYTNINNKIFPLLTSTSHDKNIQPRVYTGNWIQLLLLKYYNPNDMTQFHYFVESVEGIIVRGLSDPIPLVKDAMRKTFWTLCDLDSSYQLKITRKLDVLTIRGLSKARGIFDNTNTTRIPIKQLIKARLSSDSSNPVIKNNRISNRYENNENDHDLAFKNVHESSRKNTRSESLEIKRTTDKKPKLSVRSFTADNINNNSARQETSALSINSNEPEIENENMSNENKEDDFDDFTGRLKRDNIIYEEITSSSKEQQRDGFNKILKSNESTIAVKFHSALNQLSIINSEVFNIIFLPGNENFFKKVSNYVSTENIVRVFCLYLTTSRDYQRIEFIVNELSLEDLCLSLVNIISLAISSTTTNNVILSIQFKRNRNSIIDSILKIFKNLIIIKRGLIKSYLLTSIFDSLFTSFQIIDNNNNKNREDIDDELKKEYIEIFKFCLTEFKDTFMNSLLELNDDSNKRRIFEILGLSIDLPVENREQEDTVMTGMDGTNDSIIANRSVVDKTDDNKENEQIEQIEQKQQNDSMFDFNNLEDKRQFGEMSIGIEEDVDEGEVVIHEENKENEPPIINISKQNDKETEDIIEEGSDILMHNESVSLNGSLMLNDSSKDSEMEVNNAIMNDAATDFVEDRNDQLKINSDSTPDMDTLSIHEFSDHKQEKVEDLIVEEAKVEEVNDSINDESKVEESRVEETPEVSAENLKDENTENLIIEDVKQEDAQNLNNMPVHEYPAIDGFLGIIINDLLFDVESRNEEIKQSVVIDLNDIKFDSTNDFSVLLYNLWRYESRNVYDVMMELLEKKIFIIESLAVIKYINIVLDINNLLSVSHNILECAEEIEKHDIITSVYEIIKTTELKKLISIDKMKKLNYSLQEVILKCIYEKMEHEIENIDGEDIFMIERIIKRCIDEEHHRGIKMYSYFICKKIYEIHYKGIVDQRGIELVDGYTISNMKEKVLRYCKRFYK